MATVEIGARNRAGDLVIADTAWDYNGTLRVTVRELVGLSGNEPLPIERMRRFARRALSHPETIRSSRLVRTDHNAGCGALATFAVSRLERDR
jgi:hypothetical protein